MAPLDALQEILDEVVAPQATLVDRDGRFPTESVKALAAAGLLGLTVDVEHSGAGLGLGEATEAVRRVSQVCGSTAMVLTMHYSATAAYAATGRADVLREIAGGGHLTTLAFSESGSRSHFWAPVGTAVKDGEAVVLDASKSWVTSAHEADSYVWSSRPIRAAGPMTLWHLPRRTEGLSIPAAFNGLGLRGNDSCPVTATGVRVAPDSMLGADGGGLDLALGQVLPWFLLLNASASVGLMQSVTAQVAQHLSATPLEHLGQTLAQQIPARAKLATMQIHTDRTRALVEDTVAAAASGRADAQRLVLEVKAAADESAAMVTDLAMTAGGGAAFRKENGIERRFRDSRASRVMAPTTDALLDFVGRSICGLPLLDS